MLQRGYGVFKRSWELLYIYFLEVGLIFVRGLSFFESVVGVDQENKKVEARKILKGAMILIIKIKKHLD